MKTLLCFPKLIEIFQYGYRKLLDTLFFVFSCYQYLKINLKKEINGQTDTKKFFVPQKLLKYSNMPSENILSNYIVLLTVDSA